MTKKRKILIIILACVCAAAALFICAYFLISSRDFQLCGRIVNRVDTDRKVIALTFDDGPSDRTPEILRMLQEQGVRCTFFLAGRDIEQHKDYARAIAQAGHQTGNHSYSHERMVFKSYAFMENEIDDTSRLIRETGFDGEIVFRPPGCKKLLFLPMALRQRNMITVTWDIEPDSYPDVAASPESITEYVLDHARNGSIILLHVMHGGNSLDAVPSIVKGLREMGYEFITVNELLELSDEQPESAQPE